MGYTATGQLESFGRAEPMLAAARRTTERTGRLLLERTVHHTPVAKPPPTVDEQEWIRARRGRLPGSLRESWKMGELELVNPDGSRTRIEVYTQDRIAPFVEWPTLPHLIVPRRPGGILRFWNELGQTVYATVVHHTGTRGSFMLTTASAEIAIEWRQIAREELERWAHEQAAAVMA